MTGQLQQPSSQSALWVVRTHDGIANVGIDVEYASPALGSFGRDHNVIFAVPDPLYDWFWI